MKVVDEGSAQFCSGGIVRRDGTQSGRLQALLHRSLGSGKIRLCLDMNQTSFVIGLISKST